MASRKILVETDFLFGLREKDKLHSQVLKILNMHKRGEIEVQVLSSALLEARVVLYSEGFDPKVIMEIIELMETILLEYDVNTYVPILPVDTIIAENLRIKNDKLGFFDSLHAAISMRTGIPLLSSDKIYDEIPIKRINLLNPKFNPNNIT